MKRLIVDTHASSCYFRTSVDGDGRKALIQVTERCNLRCAHCFVSATRVGADISLDDFTGRILPELLRARVQRITLTGGEPFVHPDLLAMCRAAKAAGLPVTICTNGTLATDADIASLAGLGAQVNISFDGFTPASHGKFRGDRSSFEVTVNAARRFAAAGMLKGLLSTPNTLTDPDEFGRLCEFAIEVGAEYVLMNPLSYFGRGVKSQARLAAPADAMRAIRAVTERFADRLDLVHIRFPNDDDKPLGGCDAGKLIYVFTDGQVAVCPYLVFAARSPRSRYLDTDFLAGSIFDGQLAERLDAFDFHARFTVGTNDSCGACSISGGCGKGCPAAVVSRGGVIGDLDAEQCAGPVPVGGRTVLPLTAVGR